jgi:adenosylcobinamide-GDP ribazoletransferase
LVAAGLILLFDLFITGALHLDAFADVADAIGSRRRGDAGMAVMRDSAVGAVGAAALVAAFALRFAFLAVLVGGAEWRLITVAPIAGRSAMVWLLARGTCASDRSLAADLSSIASVPLAAITAVFALGLSVFAAAVLGALSVVSSVLIAEASAAFFRRRFGCVTGDVCGATGFVAEITALAIVSVRVAGW